MPVVRLLKSHALHWGIVPTYASLNFARKILLAKILIENETIIKPWEETKHSLEKQKLDAY